ncbi:MAG: hypothetical protein EPO08_21320 [Rhodospirillaceae bacterium]|nr:MAG: hypothetical protein EPO08_21320 [Rhodospirillaceae bacterium]
MPPFVYRIDPPVKPSPDNATRSYASPFGNISDIKITIDTALYDATARALASTFNVKLSDLGLTPKNKEQSMSTKTRRLVEDLRELDEAEFPAISSEIDALKARNKARIEQNLRGMADLATMSKPKGAPFVIAYFKDGSAKTLEGVDYAKGCYISEKEEGNDNRVYVHGRDYPVSGGAASMDSLKRLLDKRGIPFAVRYFDES